MKIKLVQLNIIWGNPEANRTHIEELFSGIEPGSADLIVLPEMFSTGFVTDHPEYAEAIAPVQLRQSQPGADSGNSPCNPDTGPNDSASGTGLCETAIWMQRRSAELGCAIAGSIAVREDGRCYNRFHFVKPDGEVIIYDKRHLFAYGGEDRTFNSGDRRVTVEWRGLRMLLAVCYDLRFPVWLRNRGDYDGILLVANWPDKRRAAWDILTKARAIENQCFLTAVNRVGTDPACMYDGGTAFINPFGEVAIAAADGCEQIISVDFNPEVQREYHTKFPVLRDADNFELLV